jgi:hypothetical protein
MTGTEVVKRVLANIDTASRSPLHLRQDLVVATESFAHGEPAEEACRLILD